MVANDNEWESAMHFLGAKDCQVTELVKLWTCIAADADDSLKKVKLIGRRGSEIHSVLSVGNKKGIIFQCAKMGSFVPNSSQFETNEILRYAKGKKWPLKVIFVVGCCGAAAQNQKIQEEGPWGEANVPNGTVFVASDLFQYSGKVVNEGTLQPKLISWHMDQYWNGLLKKVSGEEKWKIKPIDLVPFFSGDFVIKSKAFAAELCAILAGHKKVGYEMEGIGVLTATQDSESVKIALVKGVSDNAGSDKNKEAPIRFFTEDHNKVNEDTRQQMCTVMSLALVLRAIAADEQKLLS
jgi:nucleoside phosphorylase